MMQIRYEEPSQYIFASCILAGADREHRVHRLDPQQQTITVSHGTLGRLLVRLRSGQATLLPRLDMPKGEASWMLTAPTLFQLEQARIHIHHLLVPAYAVFQKKVPAFQGHSELQRAGARLYPYGYYLLRSRPEYTSTVFRLLDLWIHLEQERPRLRRESTPISYGALYERFRLELAAARWDEAEWVRREMQRLHLTSAENIQFLELEWLAGQQRWYDLWQRDDFAVLARMPIPRAVRAALLTAFHRVELLPAEQQGNWQDALEAFARHLPRLGLLLTTRLGLAHGPVVQVFAYRATHDHDRAALQALLAASDDPAARACVQQLLRLCEDRPVAPPGSEPGSALQLARAALVEENYDLAVQYAQQIGEDEARLVLLMRIAFATRDSTLAEDALLHYWELPEQQQAAMQQRYRFLLPVYTDLLQLVSPERSEQEARALQKASIKTWLDWFRRVLAQPDDPELLSSLATLAQRSDDRSWQPATILELNDLLLALVADDRLVLLPCVRDACGKLGALFLNDPAFPRTDRLFQDLYDTLYAALLARQAREELHTAFLLLRLADALLHATPGKCEIMLANLRQWAGAPMASMEIWTLEVYELLIDHGLAPRRLAAWCQEWLAWLLASARYAQWPAWLLLSQAIQPGADIVHHLERRLHSALQQDAASDVLATFADGCQIGIYSLRAGAALRARELLLARHPHLQVQVCSDEALTEQAQTLARSADLIVLVTTAMTHALATGIGPWLDAQRVVYPQASGASSIVRAVEEYARRQQPGAA